MPMSHRVHIRQLQLVTYNGDSECQDLALGDSHRSMLLGKRASRRLTKRQSKRNQQNSCPFCDSSTFPPLLAIFPRLRDVTVDVAVNRDSGLVWRTFCKAAVRNKRRVWVACTGIGEGVVMSEEKKLGMKIVIVDGKVKRVWGIVKALERDEVRRFVEYGWRSEGVGEAMRVSERVADGLLRVCWYFDADSREADDGDESASVRTEAGSRVVDGEDEKRASVRAGIECRTAHLHRWLGLSTHFEASSLENDGSDEHAVLVRKDSGRPACDESDEHMMFDRRKPQEADEGKMQRNPTGTNDDKNLNRSLDMRLDTSHWSRDFLTSLNWALRIWLKRENGDQDYEYVRIVEGLGVRDVYAAEKMKAVLLEAFGSIPQRGEFRAGV